MHLATTALNHFDTLLASYSLYLHSIDEVLSVVVSMKVIVLAMKCHDVKASVFFFRAFGGLGGWGVGGLGGWGVGGLGGWGGGGGGGGISPLSFTFSPQTTTTFVCLFFGCFSHSLSPSKQSTPNYISRKKKTWLRHGQ